MEFTKDDIKTRVDDMTLKFMENFVEVRCDKYGNEYKNANPMAIKTWFFKFFDDKFEDNPNYTTEQMGMFFFTFQYIIEQVNLYIVPFAPDIKDFCRMINVTNEELVDYKENRGQEMKTIIEKLYDFCRDGNLSLAQNKIYNASITSLKAKSELEVQEKPKVNVNINASAKLSLDEINDRLKAIRSFETKTIGTKDE